MNPSRPSTVDDVSPPAAAVATRYMLPAEPDLNMLLHASAYLATHPQPKRDDRVALQLWVKGLYRIMVAARPPARITDEDMVHALAFHTSRDVSEIRGSAHVTQLREACESALEGLRVFQSGVE